MDYNDVDNIGMVLLSALSSTIAWISLEQGQIIVTMSASMMALISGFFAARYYYYATKEKRKK